MRTASVLIADISGSTRLYETRGNVDALRAIDLALRDMEAEIALLDGVFVHSKGDDILAYFDNTRQALAAARSLVARNWSSDLTVHAGLSFGAFEEAKSDIFGKPVNVAARLAELAKPGELLVDALYFDTLDAKGQSELRSIGALPLKGVADTKEIFSYTPQGESPRTQYVPQLKPMSPDAGALITCRGQTWNLTEGMSLIVGRAQESGIVLSHAWVSRHHATIVVRGGLVEFADHSSVGSLILIEGQEALHLHRNKMFLNGEGRVIAGLSDEAKAQTSLAFRVV